MPTWIHAVYPADVAPNKFSTITSSASTASSNPFLATRPQSVHLCQLILLQLLLIHQVTNSVPVTARIGPLRFMVCLQKQTRCVDGVSRIRRAATFKSNGPAPNLARQLMRQLRCTTLGRCECDFIGGEA